MRDKIIIVVCLMLGGALLYVSGGQLDYINAQRQQMKLTMSDELEGAPPSLAFATAAMGAFRGLVVDVLWMRADQLKEQGQFFDAKQLAEWITKLQPRFASVWEFQAWNMAYNISVAIPATQPEQRWQWVRNGYELLRDKGIVMNPKSVALYRELTRILQQKIGGISDDCHKYYKLRFAGEMEPLLGDASYEFYEALTKAPKDWDSLMADPNMTAGDPNVYDLMSGLRNASDAFAERDEFIGNYLSLRQNAGRFVPEAGQVIDMLRGTAFLDKFDVFARGYMLRTMWKLDPKLMQELNNTYGPTDFSDPNNKLPLDWRHADVQAMYWGIKGVREVEQITDRDIDIMETNTDRIVGHSLQSLFRGGKMYIYKEPVEMPDPETGEMMSVSRQTIFLRPDLRMFDPYNKKLHEVIDKYSKVPGSSVESLKDGHRNMLKNAVLEFYERGHERKAREIFDELRTLYPRDEFKGTLVEYARRRFLEEFDSLGIYDAREQIISLLSNAYFLYAMREDDTAAGREKLARQIWEHYQSTYSDENRINLPEFNRLKYAALQDFLADEQFPTSFRSNLLARIKVERPELYEQLEKVGQAEMDRAAEQSTEGR